MSALACCTTKAAAHAPAAQQKPKKSPLHGTASIMKASTLSACMALRKLNYLPWPWGLGAPASYLKVPKPPTLVPLKRPPHPSSLRLPLCLPFAVKESIKMEDVMKGPYKVPSFGSWNFYEEKHVDGFVQAHFFVEDGEELFEVLSAYKHQPQERKKEKEEKKKKPRAVDDDLYKIPPELLCQIPKKRNLLKNFWAGCLCLSCMA